MTEIGLTGLDENGNICKYSYNYSYKISKITGNMRITVNTTSKFGDSCDINTCSVMLVSPEGDVLKISRVQSYCNPDEEYVKALTDNFPSMMIDD